MRRVFIPETLKLEACKYYQCGMESSPSDNIPVPVAGLVDWWKKN
jgi:hypothetical protein